MKGMYKMLWLSQSFSMGKKGGLEHNLRITKGKGLRQNGDVTRRHLNEDVLVLGDKNTKNYEYNLLIEVCKEKIGDKLAEYNERMIRTRHPERVLTIEKWLEKRGYFREGKRKGLIKEYLVNMGNRHTCCPYIQEKDEKGNLLDEKGKIIPLWDTRRAAAISKKYGYDENGKVKESAISKRVKPVYREFLQAFIEANPQAQVLGYNVHCDEGGAVHAHLDVLWWSELKPDKRGRQQGIGIGIAETEAIKQQYDKRGIKYNDTRFDNAQGMWRDEMKKLLQDIALKHGIEKLDMGNKEPHRSISEFGKYKDKYCTELEEKYNELEEEKKIVSTQKEALAERKQEVDNAMVSDIARGEWYYLKKYHPDIYKEIHTKYVNDRRKIRDKQKNLENFKNFS